VGSLRRGTGTRDRRYGILRPLLHSMSQKDAMQRQDPPPPPPSRGRARPARTAEPPADTKVAPLVTTFVYRIATGQWAEGERLPSVRAAGETWGVDRRTVLAAYRALEERGLVRGESRRGFFVAPGPELGRLGRHRGELETLHARVRAELERTGLPPASALRWIARLEEARETEEPRCAFVECTASQA